MVVRAVVAMSMLAALLGGCAAVSPGTDSGESLSKEQMVAKRAEERWALLVAGDLDGAYLFISPGIRETYSLNAYKASVNPRMWKGAKVTSVVCSSDDSCVAKTTVRIRVNMKMGATYDGEADASEAWLRREGKWWFVPDRFEGRIGR